VVAETFPGQLGGKRRLRSLGCPCPLSVVCYQTKCNNLSAERRFARIFGYQCLICGLDGNNHDVKHLNGTMTYIYDDGAVKVSRSLFEVSGTQFPIRNIGAVKRFQTSPDRSVPLLLIGIGLGPYVIGLLLKFLFGSWENWDNTAWNSLMFNSYWWLWLGCLTLGILIWRSQEVTYHLLITSSGSDIEAFSTQNMKRFLMILLALDEAISQH
jgi:hypothetical protein